MLSIPNQDANINLGDASNDRQSETIIVGVCPAASNDTAVSAANDNLDAGNPAEDTPVPDGQQVEPLSLRPNHLTDLRTSGLSDATIRAAGIYSETDLNRLTRILGWNSVPRKMSPSLVFPYFGIDGANGYCRIKPDDPRVCQGSPVKYESPKGRPNQA